MNWLSLINCAGEDQADNVTPPGYRERWPDADEATVTAALTRCGSCVVTTACAADALTDRRDGASGGVYTYHGARGVPRRWRLRAGKLERLTGSG
jgi:hypothetical protein